MNSESSLKATRWNKSSLLRSLTGKALRRRSQMSDFRPVKEVWGAHSATFVDSYNLVGIMTEIADEKELACDDQNYADKTIFWVADGKAFLEAGKRLNDADFEGKIGRASCRERV